VVGEHSSVVDIDIVMLVCVWGGEIDGSGLSVVVLTTLRSLNHGPAARGLLWYTLIRQLRQYTHLQY